MVDGWCSAVFSIQKRSKDAGNSYYNSVWINIEA